MVAPLPAGWNHLLVDVLQVGDRLCCLFFLILPLRLFLLHLRLLSPQRFFVHWLLLFFELLTVGAKFGFEFSELSVRFGVFKLDKS